MELVKGTRLRWKNYVKGVEERIFIFMKKDLVNEHIILTKDNLVTTLVVY